MTSRERLVSAMRCRPVDHVPCGPFGIARLDIDSQAVQDLIRRTDIFLPTRVRGADPFLGARARVETRREGDSTYRIVHVPEGPPLVRRIQHTDVTSATVEYPLRDLADIDRLLAIPYELPTVDPTPYVEMKARYDDQSLVLAGIGTAVCVAADWFGPENFCLHWALARERIIELTEVMNERLCRFVTACCEAGVTDFRLVGGEYVTAQLGPSGVPDLLRRPDRRLIRIIHDHGGIAFYHNHGPIMRYLEDFAEIGVDFLEPMEAPPWGDADLRVARERINGRYCMVGNLDDMEIVDKLPCDQVLEIARRRLADAGRTGFVLGGTASGTYTERAARNFIAMAELAARSG